MINPPEPIPSALSPYPTPGALGFPGWEVRRKNRNLLGFIIQCDEGRIAGLHLKFFFPLTEGWVKSGLGEYKNKELRAFLAF